MHDRRTALEGLARILDAGAPEELFTGSEEEARFLYEVLVEVARGRRSTYYWEVCRTARRRSVTPEYVADRAAVLLATIQERRRADLYRILGVPALASAEVIRQRWLEIAKRHHPDVGGDTAAFLHTRQAYNVLRDPDRRDAYERFWLRALGPFERVAGAEEVREAPVSRPSPPAPAAHVGGLAPLRQAVARLFTERGRLDARFGSAEAIGMVARLEAGLAQIAPADIQRLGAEVAHAIGQLESMRDELRRLAALKRALAA